MVINARYNITLFPRLLDCHLFFWPLLPCIVLMAIRYCKHPPNLVKVSWLKNKSETEKFLNELIMTI